jgi:PPOX class probable F420-dependent enzyme
VQLSADIIALLEKPSICYLATSMPSGSPQLTLTWVDTDGEHILINTVPTHQKVRNLRRDPRVAVALSDPADPSSYVQVRGKVVEFRSEGAVEHIDVLSHKYTGKPYPWYGGRDQGGSCS